MQHHKMDVAVSNSLEGKKPMVCAKKIKDYIAYDSIHTKF